MLELSQLLGWFEAELGREPLSDRLKGVQRLLGAARLVERHHQLAREPFSERVVVREPLEFRDDLGAAAECKVGIDARLERREPALLEPGRLNSGEMLIQKIRKRISSPDAECIPEEFARGAGFAGRQRLTTTSYEILESVQVQLCIPDVDDVAGRSPLDPVDSQHRS